MDQPKPRPQALPGGYAEHDITWEVSHRVLGEIRRLFSHLTPEEYRAERRLLRAHVCKYFSSGDCRNKNLGIAVIGTNPDGSKRLKIRWLLPGSGKRGGCRFAATAWCHEQRVRFEAVWPRQSDPSAAEFFAAFPGEIGSSG